MQLLVSGATKTVQRYLDHPNLGILLTPKNWNSVESVIATGLPWAVDNAAFSDWDENAFWNLLGNCKDQPGCLWVAVPDVPMNAKATFCRFVEMQNQVRSYGLPLAYVGQDGQMQVGVPWNCFNCFFIGGSTKWKLSEEAAELAHEAKRRGKLVHMGRVNSMRRIALAHDIGCDSFDGGSTSKFPDIYIPKWLKCIRRVQQQTIALPCHN